MYCGFFSREMSVDRVKSMHSIAGSGKAIYISPSHIKTKMKVGTKRSLRKDEIKKAEESKTNNKKI